MKQLDDPICVGGVRTIGSFERGSDAYQRTFAIMEGTFPALATPVGGASALDATGTTAMVATGLKTAGHVSKLFGGSQQVWPAPGSEDTELGVLMELEVCHGEASVYAGVQA